MTVERVFLGIAGVLGFLAVAAGAFGAHALRARLGPDMLATFETGVRYQMYHALALGGVGLLTGRFSAPQLVAAGWLFILGTAIFSGSLYALTFTGARWWGAVTPFGGVALLAGWGSLIWGVVRS
jgi:uncharacterized membrane protein YgdD (TMEM256/DUF423 family)